MPNADLLRDEDFIEDCRTADRPGVELTYCYGCHRLWPVSELSGGFCGDCAAPVDEEEQAKAPAVTSSGVIHQGAGRDRRTL